MTRYEVVPCNMVNQDLRIMASYMLEFCLNDLGIKNKPKVNWISECGIYGCRRYFGETIEQEKPVYGFVRFSDNAIFLNISQNITTVKNTMAHECRHIYQREKLVNRKMPIPIGYDQEIDARAYAQDAEQAMRFWPGTTILARQCTSKGFYIQQEAPKARVDEAPNYDMHVLSGNGTCQKEGCERPVVYRFSNAPISRHFCDMHAKGEIEKLNIV